MNTASGTGSPARAPGARPSTTRSFGTPRAAALRTIRPTRSGADSTATARQYGVRNAYKEAANLDAGVRHLKTLLDRFAVREAVAAYNAGQTNVDRWVRAAGGPGSFNADDDIPF